VREGFRRGRKTVRPSEFRQAYSAIPRSGPRHQQRSPTFSFRSDGLSRRNRGCNRGSVGKTTSQFSDCWPLRDATDFLKEVVRQRQADESCSRLKFSMQVIRYVAELNHLRHGHSLSACAQHVNSTEARNGLKPCANRPTPSSLRSVAQLRCRRCSPEIVKGCIEVKLHAPGFYANSRRTVMNHAS